MRSLGLTLALAALPLVASLSRAGAPEDYPYVALRIEPDRLGIVYYTGFGIEEIESVDAVTEAGKWYTVRVRGMVGGVGLCVALERFGEDPGDTVAILAQSLPLSALPSCGGDAIGFTVGEAADYEFQLVSRTNDLDTSGYFVDWDHDAYGRKIAETVYDNGAEVSAQTLYVWDGWRLLAEIDGLTGKQLANYVHGPAYIDDLVASFRDLDDDGTFDDANEHRYHLTDHQHSTIALLSPTGNVLERYAYDPFGVPTIHDPSGTPLPGGTALGNHHLYTGREWLPGPGLYDLRNRNYDPANGRFLTNDPLGLHGDPANLGNPYTYVGNNPGAFVDPYGDYAELVVEIPSILLGISSFVQNITDGNYGSAALDAAGVAVDIAGAGIPAVPGGAGLAIKAHRVASTAVDTAQTAEGVHASVSEGDYVGAARDVAGAVVRVPRRAVGGGALGVVADEGAGDVTKAERKAPNPGGRLGDQTTKETTRSVVEALEQRGFTVRTERGFKKAAPDAGSRYADVVGTRQGGSGSLVVNIGKKTKKGEPIARERRALEDLRTSPDLKRGDQVIFIEKGASGLPPEF